MKKDNYTQNVYMNYSPTPPPPPNFINYNTRNLHKESQFAQNHSKNNITESNQRYSHNIEPTNPSSNAFTHLRNQISNLRTQFSKLIQKDLPNTQSTIDNNKEKQQYRTMYPSKKQQKPAISFITFTPHGNTKEFDKKNDYFHAQKIKKQDSFNINIDNKQKERRNFMANQSLQKFNYPKKYSFQIHQAKQQNDNVNMFEKIRLQQAQAQVRRLQQNKTLMQFQIYNLKRELQKKQEIIRKLNNQQDQKSFLKAQNQQNQISLSLKNSLVQKLQEQLRKNQKLLQHYCNLNTNKQRQNQYLTNQLKKMNKKYVEQIQKLQNIQKNNINEIINKYTQQINNLNMNIFQNRKKMEQIKNHEEKSYFWQNQFKKLQQYLIVCQNNVCIVQNQIKIKNQKIQILENQLQQLNNVIKVKDMDVDDKNKNIQEQNADLKKRVEYYKKTVEQLNTSNNSSRQKILFHKQQSKKIKQQLKIKSQDLLLKQNLITSLYKDINILDNEIRHHSNSKNIIVNLYKSIDQLNHIIIVLQCQKLSHKYSEDANQKNQT